MNNVSFVISEWAVPDRKPVNRYFPVSEPGCKLTFTQYDVSTSLCGDGGRVCYSFLSLLNIINVQLGPIVLPVDGLSKYQGVTIHFVVLF